ncbi:MAG: hypothetical protein PHW28_11520 [Mesotoga sp.]|nr:hypothetical protein [Mesotoga sp.]
MSDFSSGVIAPVKTIQTELLAITAIAANAQQKSSTLDITGYKSATIFIDHARDATTAFNAVGTEYKVQVSEKATGNDTWRTISSVVCDITAAADIVMDELEPAGETVIACGATLPAVNDKVFFKNSTLANSEWGTVVAIVSTGGSESFTLSDGLTNAQAALAHMYNKAEQFVMKFNVEDYTRLRVVVNNNNAATTNVAIVSRIACTASV